MLHEDYASAFRRRVQVSKVCLRDEICEAHPCIELQPTDHTQHATVPSPALPCPALPCPALPCPALPCPALPSPPIPSSIQFATDNRQVCDRQVHPCVGLPQRDGIRTGGADGIRQMRQAALYSGFGIGHCSVQQCAAVRCKQRSFAAVARTGGANSLSALTGTTLHCGDRSIPACLRLVLRGNESTPNEAMTP
jgi:hypothetical protein